MRRARSILIIDDETKCTNRFARTFRKRYDLEVADDRNGEELIAEKSYDVIVLDIRMPERNGVELFESIRARDRRHRLRDHFPL